MLQSRIRRGELDREISFIRKKIGNSSYNEDKETGWEYIPTDYTVAAMVKQRAGKEMVIADRLTFVSNTIFTVDYREDLDTEMRVVYKQKVYEIISISENESDRDRYLNVVASLLDTEPVVIDGVGISADIIVKDEGIEL